MGSRGARGRGRPGCFGGGGRLSLLCSASRAGSGGHDPRALLHVLPGPRGVGPVPGEAPAAAAPVRHAPPSFSPHPPESRGVRADPAPPQAGERGAGAGAAPHPRAGAAHADAGAVGAAASGARHRPGIKNYGKRAWARPRICGSAGGGAGPVRMRAWVVRKGVGRCAGAGLVDPGGGATV